MQRESLGAKVSVPIEAIARVFNNARRSGETVLVTFLLGFSGPLVGSGSESKGEPSSTGAPRKIANGAMRHRHQFTRGAALTCNNHDARRQRSVVANERNLCSIRTPTRERIFRTLGDGARRMLCLRVGNPDRSLIGIARADHLALKQHAATIGGHLCVADTDKAQ